MPKMGQIQASDVWSVTTRTLTDILGTNYTAARAGYLDELASSNLPTDVDNVLTRLSATRAGYLDELAAANIPADVDTLKARVARGVCILDFWSDVQEEVTITAAAQDLALPDVVVAGIPSGATLLRVVAMLKFRAVENTNAAVNKINVAQSIQVRDDTPGSYVDCINIPDDIFAVAATTREGGDVIIGDNDVKATVDANDTYNFQWYNARADQANLQFNDCQTGLRVFFTL